MRAAVQVSSGTISSALLDESAYLFSSELGNSTLRHFTVLDSGEAHFWHGHCHGLARRYHLLSRCYLLFDFVRGISMVWMFGNTLGPVRQPSQLMTPNGLLTGPWRPF